MAYQTVFKRYELKYMLTQEQKRQMLACLAPYMIPDKYPQTTIRNVYYDSEDHLLIRRSLDKPIYKEKLRHRSYTTANADTPTFVELKKKYRHIVYKRRLSLPLCEAERWLDQTEHCKTDSQISREIDYFLTLYADRLRAPLRPALFLCYDREAYYQRDGGDLRITFDQNILYRAEQCTLAAEPYGTPLLERGTTLMEIKCGTGLPLWLTSFLSEKRIYRISYSKYGEAYKRLFADTATQTEAYHA